MKWNTGPLVFPVLCTLLTAISATAATLPTGSILINNGAASTTSSTPVTLNLSATDYSGTGIASMHFRNATTDPYSDWEPYQTTRSWVLTGDPGTKKVYVQFMDGAGNVSDANPASAGAQGYSDAIELADTTPPTGSILINNGAASTASSTVTLNLTAADGGGSGVASMHFRNTTTDPYSSWEPYQTTRTWELTGDPGTKKVYVQFMDVAGNLSDANPTSVGAQGYGRDRAQRKDPAYRFDPHQQRGRVHDLQNRDPESFGHRQRRQRAGVDALPEHHHGSLQRLGALPGRPGAGN